MSHLLVKEGESLSHAPPSRDHTLHTHLIQCVCHRNHRLCHHGDGSLGEVIAQELENVWMSQEPKMLRSEQVSG